MLHPLPCAYMLSPIPRRRRPALFRCAPHWAVPVAGSLPRDPGGSASALTFSRPARRSLALRPARSLSRPRRPFFTEVLQSISLPRRTAPIATGWNETSCRAGLPPAGVRCLRTAHGVMWSEDRLEAKLDKIETLLIDYILGIGVHGDESTSEPAGEPAGPGKGASQLVPAKPVVPERGSGL